MNYIDNFEFVFWLDGWRDDTSFTPKRGQFKCVITKNKISIDSVEHKINIMDINIALIQDCKIAYSGKGAVQFVTLILNNKKIALFPINPFNPSHMLHANGDEVIALLEVLNAFRSNFNAQVNTNPYLRQLSANNKNKYFRSFDEIQNEHIDWDKHTSPWMYYDLYGDKYALSKIFVTTVVFGVVTILIIFCIVFLLDWLNII